MSMLFITSPAVACPHPQRSLRLHEDVASGPRAPIARGDPVAGRAFVGRETGANLDSHRNGSLHGNHSGMNRGGTNAAVVGVDTAAPDAARRAGGVAVETKMLAVAPAKRNGSRVPAAAAGQNRGRAGCGGCRHWRT